MAERNMVEAVNDAMMEEMRRDARVIVMGEDVGEGGVFRATQGLLPEFGPDRCIDTPLAESSIVGVAIGASLNGIVPIAEIQFADFIHPAMDQIVNEAARLRYRSREEVEEWSKKDPITRFQAYLEEHGFLDAKARDAMTKRAAEEIDAATDYAEKAAPPEPESALRHVFAEEEGE